MDSVFLKILNMSITASWLILAVVALRLVLKKAPKAIICALWTIVAIRLICPFSFESTFSLIPSTETISQDILYSQTPGITSGIPAINSVVNPVITGSLAPEVGASVNPLQVWTIVASCVWVVGVAAMLGYAVVSYLRIKKKVREGTPLRDNIWLCDHIDTPFILGVLHPRIYLPSAMGDAQSDYVVAHENAHLKRHDHWWKPLGFLLLAIYWFNPLCWLAYVLLCRDIETACDEKVVKDWDAHNKKAYSEVLLSCSVPRRMVAACPLAFGEMGVKERIKTVLNYKKPAFWIIVVAVVTCIVVAVCFLTDPKDDEQDLSFLNYENLVTLAAQSDTLPTHLSNKSGGTYEYSIKGSELAQFLDAAQWTRQSGMLRSVQRDAEKSKESIQIDIDDGLYLRVFDSDTAYVYDGTADDGKYYRMQNDDYNAILTLVDGARQGGRISATQWFDGLHDDEMVWNGIREISLDEFPGVTFRWHSEKLEAVTDTEIVPLYTGMPIWSVFFCDLTGDGKPELCSTVSIGSGIVDNRVIIYDYANGASYELSDRPHFDYTLSLENGRLLVEKRGCMQEELLEVGALGYQDNTIQIVPESISGGVEHTGFIYQTAYSWANYSEDGYAAMVEWAENRDTERRYGNIEHLTPVVKIDSKVEFDDFYEEMSAYFNLTQGYDEVGAFSAQAEQYTEEFFAEQSLFIAYLEENTSSNRHKVEEVRIENGILEIRICQIAPDSFDTAMAGWFISVAIPKVDITDCTGYDAYICATVNPNAVFPGGNLIHTYVYEGDDLMHTAAVSLYDSGEFIFTFSPLSSYIGHGVYTMENDRLTLQTDDGNYTYVFDIVNDTLVFDGGSSSTNTWYSGFTDGAIFE